MLLTGFFVLEHDLYVHVDVLGKTFQSTIAGHGVSVSFPQYNSEYRERALDYVGLSNPLLPPDIASKWKKNGESLDWGCPESFPEITASIHRFVITTECNSSNEMKIASQIYADINRWGNSFIDYCLLVTKQNYIRDKNKFNYKVNFSLYDSEYISTGEPITLYWVTHDIKSAITFTMVEDALKYASSGEELYLEYQMLLNSYKAVASFRNRQAILDACAALELCLNKAIQQFCDEKSFPSEVLFSQYRYMGSKVELIKKLYPDVIFPSTTKKDVIQVRNNVVHTLSKVMIPSDEETDVLIECVNKWLNLFHTGYYKGEKVDNDQL